MADDWLLTALDDATTRISALARQGSLDEPVDHLNRWKVRDVVAHLGGVHRWATRIVTERSIAGPSFKKSKLDGIELCDWFDEGAAGLLETFRRHELDEPCPNFNPGSERTIAWWVRRQAHESTVHRWDIEVTLGDVTPIAPNLAVDGIDEFLDVFVRTRGKQTLQSPLVLRTTRPSRSWTLTPAAKPGRIDVSPGKPDARATGDVAEVAGKPDALLLAVWGRKSVSAAGLAISGDATVAESLFSL